MRPGIYPYIEKKSARFSARSINRQAHAIIRFAPSEAVLTCKGAPMCQIAEVNVIVHCSLLPLSFNQTPPPSTAPGIKVAGGSCIFADGCALLPGRIDIE